MGFYLLRLLGLSVTLSLGASCATAQPRYDYASEPDPRKSEYVLGPSDMLKIAIWHNPDLSADATVRPDGAYEVALTPTVENQVFWFITLRRRDY